MGFLSGMFGVGGGFLMTPMLIFLGVPPAVAVAHAVPADPGLLRVCRAGQFRRKAVDLQDGLGAGGRRDRGLGAGVALFSAAPTGPDRPLRRLSYVMFLGTIGGLMLAESLGSLLRSRRPTARRAGCTSISGCMAGRSRCGSRPRASTSASDADAVGAFGGLLAAILGIGGGFVMVPAMIYIIGMPTAVVVGTSLFQICFVSGATGFLQAYANQTVDILLALLLIAGGVVGAQFGTRAGAYLRGEQLRVLLAAMVLMVCGKLAWDIVATPVDL